MIESKNRLEAVKAFQLNVQSTIERAQSLVVPILFARIYTEPKFEIVSGFVVREFDYLDSSELRQGVQKALNRV